MKSLVEKDVLRLKGSDADSLLTTSSPVGTEDTRVRGVLANVELFEWIGIAASVAAAWIFFTYGRRLDELVGIPNYHWQVVWVISGIYLHSVPWALLIGTVLLIVWWKFSGVQQGKRLTRYLFAVRVFLAYCVLLIVFRIVNFYVPVLHPGIEDALLQRMDSTLFGGLQVGEWLQPLVPPLAHSSLNRGVRELVLATIRDDRAANYGKQASCLGIRVRLATCILHRLCLLRDGTCDWAWVHVSLCSACGRHRAAIHVESVDGATGLLSKSAHRLICIDGYLRVAVPPSVGRVVYSAGCLDYLCHTVPALSLRMR